MVMACRARWNLYGLIDLLTDPPEIVSVDLYSMFLFSTIVERKYE